MIIIVLRVVVVRLRRCPDVTLGTVEAERGETVPEKFEAMLQVKDKPFLKGGDKRSSSDNILVLTL